MNRQHYRDQRTQLTGWDKVEELLLQGSDGRICQLLSSTQVHAPQIWPLWTSGKKKVMRDIVYSFSETIEFELHMEENSLFRLSQKYCF